MKILNRRGVAVATVAAVAVSLGGASGAWAADVGGNLVATRLTSSWNPPSPDPSGIAYDPSTNTFIISDGEVEEMTIYRGANLFSSSPVGALVGTEDTQPWSEEPTGVAVNPNGGEIYVSDDDQRSVFVLQSLSDPSPRVIGQAKFTAHGVDPDLEGVGYDSRRNEILVANGERGAGFWRVSPGGDSQFGTADDVVAPKILVAAAQDPEGIAYDAARDTVVMVDGATDRIYEMNATGTVLNTINIAGMGMDAAAGIEVAPASNGSGARHYYIVDRGVDNNSDPNENDGKLFEVAAVGLPPSDANQPPTANAGPDQVITLGQNVTLNGSGSDVETPANQLTYAWTKLSGPAQPVTFGSPNAAVTTAGFTAPGTYVLRLAVSDGSITSFDNVTVTVGAVGSDITVEVPITAGNDDASEGSATGTKFVDLTTRQLSIGNRQPGTGDPYPVTIGLRFANIPIPQGGEVQSARIRFVVDAATSGAAAFSIKGEAADNAPTFTSSGTVTDGPPTTASVPWTPADWPTVNAQVRTPDVKTVLQEIVNRPGWAQGNAAVFTIDGTGRRAAKSFEGNAAPVLELTYSTTPAPANTAPTVSAGADAAVTLPATAALDGTVTDDGNPKPPALTTTWSKVDGPGTVTFGDASMVDTTAAFSEPGTYTLRLTANDGALSTSDDVVVTVTGAAPANTAPVVSAGPDATITLPASATLSGSVTDDGKPTPPGATTATWSKVSGPGNVTFGDAAKPATTAAFSAAGTYVLKLSASDSVLTGEDQVTITVKPAGGGGPGPEPGNAAPVVNAGADASVTLPAKASLNGTATDDGKPAPAKLTTTWSKVSGPGSVTFDDASKPVTKAAFSKAGSYTLRLTANDGALSASDTVAVTVKAEAEPGDLTVSLTANKKTVNASDRVRLSGQVSGTDVAGVTVDVYAKRAPKGQEVKVGTATTGSDGKFSVTDRPTVNSHYYAMAGDAVSDSVRVKVRPRLSAMVRHVAVHAGTSTVIKGRLTPSEAGQTIKLQHRNGGKWRTMRKLSREAGSGLGYRFVVSSEKSRVVRYRVVVPAFAGRARVVADGLKVRYYKAEIKRVNTSKDFVTVRNTGVGPISLEGWRLRNRRTGQVVHLPEFTLRKNRIVRIHSGKGRSDRNDLYLRGSDMWSGHGWAVLRDARARVSDLFRF